MGTLCPSRAASLKALASSCSEAARLLVGILAHTSRPPGSFFLLFHWRNTHTQHFQYTHNTQAQRDAGCRGQRRRAQHCQAKSKAEVHNMLHRPRCSY